MSDQKRPEQNKLLSSEKDQERQLQTLISLSDKFGESLANAFSKNVSEGKKLGDTLKAVRQSLVESSLRLALAPLQLALSQSVKTMMTGALQGGAQGNGQGAASAAPLELGKIVGSLFSSLFGGGGGAAPAPFAQGGVISRGAVLPFAQGGVVGAPTYFPLGRGLGLMGERGAEAVMPLARGPDGRLGVRGGGGGRPVSVNVSIATPDAESFRRSEAQVSAALARAVARGQRGM
ncbi:MAG TPA: phage tail tape measure protein [Microvirga sp.]|jgi:hypothetical protein